ncbi:unnamed protein product [Sphagnum balticum]
MFYKLQVCLFLICQQHAYVNKLVVNLQMVYELCRIDMDAEFGDFDASNYFQRFDWFVTFESLELFVKHNSRNKPANKDAPPIMLSDLVCVQHVVFFRNVLQPWNVHLIKVNWDEDAIYEIEQQHCDLVKAYKYEPPVKTILD